MTKILVKVQRATALVAIGVLLLALPAGWVTPGEAQNVSTPVFQTLAELSTRFTDDVVRPARGNADANDDDQERDKDDTYDNPPVATPTPPAPSVAPAATPTPPAAGDDEDEYVQPDPSDEEGDRQ